MFDSLRTSSDPSLFPLASFVPEIEQIHFLISKTRVGRFVEFIHLLQLASASSVNFQARKREMKIDEVTRRIVNRVFINLQTFKQQSLF